MNRLMYRLIGFKTLMLMYFAGGVFALMLWDLFFTRAGAVPAATLWEVFLMTALFAAAHFFCYTEGVLPNVSQKAKAAVHAAAAYGIGLGCVFLFGWAPRLSAVNILAATGIFLVIYAAMWFGFYIYYKAQRAELNEKLERYKNT